MSKESLDSDRVNYLIWRYLVESDYRETAVRLQKEWNIEHPEQLLFAPHVTNHALVSILNRGLLYNVSEREFARTTGNIVVPVSGFFGPLTPTSPTEAANDFNDEEFENARKRQNDDDQVSIQNGPISKRPRLSNGYENGLESAPSGTAMEVDAEQNGHGRAYPSPEQLPSPIVVTNGPEQGTQVEKVIDLSTETTFLDLTEPVTSRVPTLLHCAWSPTQPESLAAAGTDALARIWTIKLSPATRNASTAAHKPGIADLETVNARVDAVTEATRPMGAESNGNPDVQMDDNNNHVESNSNANSNGMVHGRKENGEAESSLISYRNIIYEATPPDTTTTALCWSSNGEELLVAKEPVEDARAWVDVYALYGMRRGSFDGFEPPIICLRWNFSNRLILALSPSSESSMALITVACRETWTKLTYTLPAHKLDEQPLDAVWTSDEDFILCGGDLLQAFRTADGAIYPIRKYETQEGNALSKVTFDWPTQLLATASDLGKIDIWDKQGQCRSFDAHQGLITSLEWQPLPMQIPQLLDGVSERLLASAGEDGAISIWNARSPDSRPRASMTMRTAVLALAFTPDGSHIAGATNEEVLIWKVEDVNMPRAVWRRGTEPGWQTPLSRDSAAEEENYCLSWDSNGQRLAYGVNNMLAVMNFRR